MLLKLFILLEFHQMLNLMLKKIQIFTQKGENLLKLIYGKQYEPLREKLKYYHPDIERAIVDCAYGRVLARPHVTPAERELCSLACLAGETVIPQLHSHLLGALNAGATLHQIRGILDQTATVWGTASQIIVDGYWLDFVSHVYARHQA